MLLSKFNLLCFFQQANYLYTIIFYYYFYLKLTCPRCSSRHAHKVFLCMPPIAFPVITLYITSLYYLPFHVYTFPRLLRGILGALSFLFLYKDTSFSRILFITYYWGPINFMHFLFYIIILERTVLICLVCLKPYTFSYFI